MRLRIDLAALAVAAAFSVGTTASALASTTHSTAKWRPPAMAYQGGAGDGEQTFVMAASGAKLKLGPGVMPMISPNGKYVAATGGAAGGLSNVILYRSSGGKIKSFLPSASDNPSVLAWSADSRYIAVSDLGATTADDSLVVIDTQTQTATVVAKGFVEGASFAPSGVGAPKDELVYGIAKSLLTAATVNLYESAPSGATKTQITHNGRSLNPVWTRRGIVFDRERLRPKEGYPAFQLWLLVHGRQRQLTHMKIGPLVSGLVPIAASASGNRLIASYEGEDTDYAWRVQISPLKVSAIAGYPQAGDISADGTRLLVFAGAFENPVNHGVIEWLPFSGGPVHKLARGGYPTWAR